MDMWIPPAKRNRPDDYNETFNHKRPRQNHHAVSSVYSTSDSFHQPWHSQSSSTTDSAFSTPGETNHLYFASSSNEPHYAHFGSNEFGNYNFEATDYSAASTKSPERCLGMLAQLDIQSLSEQKKSQLLRLTQYDAVCICSLQHELADRYAVICEDMEPVNATIGYLSRDDSYKLKRFCNSFSVHLIGVFFQNSPETAISFGLEVYTSSTEIESIAQALSQAGYFLQDPRTEMALSCYHNPQYLELLISGEPDPFIEETPLSIDYSNYIQNDTLDFDAIMNNFARQGHLSQIDVDDRVLTPLLDYQREGLDFVLKRESNSASLERSLWKQEESDDNEPIYRHTITGATSPSPKEVLGGILADEMGLGKSLVMLSAIIASLQDAQNYAMEKSSFADDPNQSILAARSTLLIVPSALLIDNWIEQILTHVAPGQLSYYKYHDFRRDIGWSELLQYDVVLTTYGTVAADLKRPGKLLSRMFWYRIILDEAHIIRNAQTHKFKAVRSLQSFIRWCVTGTPIQNNLEDLASLLRVLRMPIFEEAPQFRRHITANVQPTQEGTRDLYNLQTLLQSICLRRNKTVLPVFSTTEETCYIELSSAESEQYRRVGELCLAALKNAVNGHQTSKGHATVLETILKLRLFCNNGYDNSVWASSILQDFETTFALLQQEDRANCYYCRLEVVSVGSFDDPESGKITKCRNLICTDCLGDYHHGFKKGTCPMCDSQHKESEAGKSSPLNDETLNLGEPSKNWPSKLLKLCENIHRHEHSEKSIVFSCWKKTLNIMCKLFDEQNIRYLRLDGDVPYTQRRAIIMDFQTSSQGMVLLMTVGVGAVGLNNLSVASQIHILEPQWNPSVEAQAVGRIVRLGQERPVTITRYLVSCSVETSVRDRQIQKLKLSRDGFGSHQDNDQGQLTAKMLSDLIFPKSNGADGES